MILKMLSAKRILLTAVLEAFASLKRYSRVLLFSAIIMLTSIFPFIYGVQEHILWLSILFGFLIVLGFTAFILYAVHEIKMSDEMLKARSEQRERVEEVLDFTQTPSLNPHLR